MPAITSLTISAAAPLGRVLSALAGRARRGLKQLAEKVKNRHDAMRLAELDDRMLADIGLSRSDLRDAFALPPWRDPSDVLARRAAERRGSRRRTESSCVPVTTVSRTVRDDALHLVIRRTDLRLISWPILPSATVRNGGFPSRPPDAAPAAPRRAHSFCRLQCARPIALASKRRLH